MIGFIGALLFVFTVAAVSCTGPLRFSKNIKEWKNTTKRIVWICVWWVVLSMMVPIYVVSYILLDYDVFGFGLTDANIFMLAAMVSIVYWAIVVIPIYGGIFTRRLKKKYEKTNYAIVDDYSDAQKEEIRKRFKNDPEFREQWLKEQQAKKQSEANQNRDV